MSIADNKQRHACLLQRVFYECALVRLPALGGDAHQPRQQIECRLAQAPVRLHYDELEVVVAACLAAQVHLHFVRAAPRIGGTVYVRRILHIRLGRGVHDRHIDRELFVLHEGVLVIDVSCVHPTAETYVQNAANTDDAAAAARGARNVEKYSCGQARGGYDFEPVIMETCLGEPAFELLARLARVAAESGKV